MQISEIVWHSTKFIQYIYTLADMISLYSADDINSPDPCTNIIYVAFY